MKYDSEVAHERAENARLVAELRAVKSDLAAAREELVELRALEMNHEGACVRLKRELAELRDALSLQIARWEAVSEGQVTGKEEAPWAKLAIENVLSDKAAAEAEKGGGQ